MLQISNDDGSGGYQRPWVLAAALTSAFSAPGRTVACMAAGSIRMSTMARVDKTIDPSSADEPPESPVPAPRVTTATRCSSAMRSATATSSVLVARTTAAG